MASPMISDRNTREDTSLLYRLYEVHRTEEQHPS